MTRRLCVILPAILYVLACHAPVTVTTPAGKAAYTADQVVTRLGELQNAAIQANQGGALDTNTTRSIVTYVVATTKTLQQTPAGWVATVQAGWHAFLPTLPASITGNPNWTAVVAAVTVAVDGLQ